MKRPTNWRDTMPPLSHAELRAGFLKAGLLTDKYRREQGLPTLAEQAAAMQTDEQGELIGDAWEG